MAITKDEVAKVAVLARLELSDEDAQLYAASMNDILVHMDKLASIDTDGVEPTYHAVEKVNAFRRDVVLPGLDHATALANAPEADEDSIIVPKVI